METAAQDLSLTLHALYLEWSVLMETYQRRDDTPSSAPSERSDGVLDQILEQILSDTQVIAAISENLLNVLVLQWRKAEPRPSAGDTGYSEHKQMAVSLLECLASLQKSR